MSKTKILRYDLGEDLLQILDQLEVVLKQVNQLRADRTEEDLSVLLQKIDVDMLDASEKAVIQDLLDQFDSAKKHMGERVEDLEDDVKKLNEAILNAGLAERDQEEEFTYDTYGNVSVQTIRVPNTTGGLDVLYKENYTYTDPQEGKLNYSTKVYTTSDGKTATVKKTYTYNGDDITKIKTETTIV